MPREERIEAILAAWYEFQTCEPSEKAKFREQRDKLINEVIAASGGRSCRQELLEALAPRFSQYKLARHKEHEAKMAAILRKR